jgi:uncharacterized membrane protein
MTPQSPSPAGIGVVLGYATAASMVLMIFVQLGLFAVLLAPVMCVLHWVTARGHDSVNASHHRFLARTWLYAIIAQLAVLTALGFAFAEVWNLGAIIIDAVAAAQPGEEAAMAFDSLAAYLDYTAGRPLFMLVAAFLVHGVATTVIGAWLSVRLVRRWLRWSDRRPA